MNEFLGMQPNASVHGAGVDSLISWVHWLMLALFVGWGLFYIVCLVKFRAKANPKADYEGVKNHYSTYLELIVAAIEAVLLIGFSIPIWASAVDEFPKESEATVVQVVAEQFAWNYHYAGADGKFGKTDPKLVNPMSNPVGIDPNDPNGLDDFVTLNEMVVPEDKPVITKITSKDVIHAFGSPALRLKQDAIPGMVVPVWFKATKKGEFEVACSQLCGSGHYSMRSVIKVTDQEAYATWTQAQIDKKNSGGGGDDW